MTQTLYHGSEDTEIDFDAANPMRERYDLCLTPDREIAETYGDEVYELRFEGYCSTPEDVVEVADKHDLQKHFSQRIEADSPYFYLLLDDERVQDALIKEGHEAVRFTDENIRNRRHETIRVLEPGHITEA
jgi:hypothetical protein